jgi:predicted nucleic acid-binding protein
MRVVIDTNVVVSAALKDRNPEAIILFVAKHLDLEWVASAEIVAEYTSVLRRAKFALPESIIQRWTNIFDTLIAVVEVKDPFDFHVIKKMPNFLHARWRQRQSIL